VIHGNHRLGGSQFSLSLSVCLCVGLYVGQVFGTPIEIGQVGQIGQKKIHMTIFCVFNAYYYVGLSVGQSYFYDPGAVP